MRTASAGAAGYLPKAEDESFFVFDRFIRFLVATVMPVFCPSRWNPQSSARAERRHCSIAKKSLLLYTGNRLYCKVTAELSS